MIWGTIPIQVKQSEGVGRPEIDKFAYAANRAGKKKGVFVAFSYSKGAFEEMARAKLNNGIVIKFLSYFFLTSLQKTYKVTYLNG